MAIVAYNRVSVVRYVSSLVGDSILACVAIITKCASRAVFSWLGSGLINTVGCHG